MQTPPRVSARYTIAMQPSPAKTPPKQIPGQVPIDDFMRPQPKTRPNDDSQLTSTPPLQRKRRINDDDDDDDDRPMISNPTRLHEGTIQDPVFVADTENESDANFGVVLLPQRRQTRDESQDGTRLRAQSKRTKPSTLDHIAEQVRPLIIDAATEYCRYPIHEFGIVGNNCLNHL